MPRPLPQDFQGTRYRAELGRKKDARYGVLRNAENIAVPESLHVLTASNEHRTRRPVQMMPASQVQLLGTSVLPILEKYVTCRPNAL